MRGETLSVARSAGLRRRRRALSLHVVLGVAALITLLPFFWMLILSVSAPGSLHLPNLIPSAVTLSYFEEALSNAGVVRWALNSFIYSGVSVVVSLLLASAAGYAFAKKRFPGHRALFWSFVAMLMVPAQLTIVPLYLLIAWAGGVDTYWGLILPTLASAQAVFLIRQYVLGLPDELFEAAKLDGASEWRVFTAIVLPLCRPILATLGIFVFLFHWNDFFWPLLAAQSDDMRTLTVGLATMQARAPTTGSLMASTALSFVPCLVVFVGLQRYITQGIALTGFR